MRILLLCCCLVFLRAGEAGPAAWEALPAPARDLVERILVANLLLEPELDAAAARRAFVELVEECRPPVGVSDPRAVTKLLNTRILTGRQVSYLSRQYWRDSSFAAALLRRQGNCLATTTLYVAVARALGLPIRAVLVPEHAFACWADGARRFNIETTAGGAVQTDLAYFARFAIDSQDFTYYGWMNPLDDERLLAELELVAARHLAGQQRFAEAQSAMTAVRTALPQRVDLELQALDWAAQLSGDRQPLMSAAQRYASDASLPRAATLAAVLTLAAEYRGRLDRAPERAALQRAYGLARWHEQDEILERLSLCLRGLRDHSGAALCMELAVARAPDNLWKRAWLAGMLSESGRLDEGLRILAAVREENPEEVHFAIMQAGMLVQSGQRDEGRRIFDAIVPPRTGLETFEINRAWFLAVWGDRVTFYTQFEKALALAKDPSVLSWIAEDDDLDRYRAEERFTSAVAACRQRLLDAMPER